MTNKRHSHSPEPSSTKRSQNSHQSVLSYFKNHCSYQTFNSKDLLLVLNCETPETAKKEAESQIKAILEIKKLRDEVRTFVSSLLIDDLRCLTDSSADLYWAEKRSVAALMANSHKQFQVYQNVSSSVMDKSGELVEKDVVAENQILSPASSVEANVSLENIWSIWSDVVYDMLTGNLDDKQIHEYSLEYLGIIALGNHIGNNQSRQWYPKELVSKTNKATQTGDVDVFYKFFSFYSPLFESLAVSLDECHTLLLRNSLRVKKTADPGLQFTYDFFTIFVTQILNNSDVISKQESIYNYRAIFRFFDAVVSTTPSWVFFPGETRLQAIRKELERQEMSTKSYYNADGIIFNKDTGLEVCLLETSGPFGLVDKSRETKDHVKAAYGLLSMLHTIAHQFPHADIQVFQKLKIYFIHAAQDRVRLWSFSLIDKELYALNRLDSAAIPATNSDGFKVEFMRLVNLFWKLKVLLDDTEARLNEIKESHTSNETAYRNGQIKDLPRLDQYLVENAEVKLSFSVSNVSDIYLSSSPIRPDSP